MTRKSSYKFIFLLFFPIKRWTHSANHIDRKSKYSYTENRMSKLHMVLCRRFFSIVFCQSVLTGRAWGQSWRYFSRGTKLIFCSSKTPLRWQHDCLSLLCEERFWNTLVRYSDPYQNFCRILLNAIELNIRRCDTWIWSVETTISWYRLVS